MSTSVGSEQFAVLAVIDPAAIAASTVTSGWVFMGNWQSVTAIVKAGVLGAAATLDAKLQQATSSAGAGAKDIVGASIAQLTKAAADDNKQSILNVRAGSFDINGGFNYVRLSVTVAVATSTVDVILLGVNGFTLPASNNDNASVKNIKTV